MPTQTLHFDSSGTSLSVRVRAGQAALGSYGLFLFEHDGFTIVKPSPWKADFDDNVHSLPGAASNNDGRILDLVYSVGMMDATRAYAVHLTLLQGTTVLATASDVGVDTGTGPTHVGKLLALLSGAAAKAVPNMSLKSLLQSSAPKGKKAPSTASRTREVDKAARAQLRKQGIKNPGKGAKGSKATKKGGND